MKRKKISLFLLTCFALSLIACGETSTSIAPSLGVSEDPVISVENDSTLSIAPSTIDSTEQSTELPSYTESVEESIELPSVDETSLQSSEELSIEESVSISVPETYPCIIQNDSEGVVTTDKDLAQSGELVTITIAANTDSIVLGLKVNGTIIYEGDLSKIGTNKYTYTTEMTEDGLNIQGLFMGDSTQVTFSEEVYDTPAGEEGATITLPEFKAYDANGIDVSAYIEVIDETDPNAVVVLTSLVSNLIGTHTIKYRVINPITKNVINEKTIQAIVYMKIIGGYTNGMVIDNPATDPTLRTTDTGISAVNFNFEKGKYYYAEWQMDAVTNYSSGQIIGASHNVADNAIPTDGLYYNGFKFNASGFEMAHSKYVTNWGDVGGKRLWIGSSYATRNNVSLDITTSNTKLAIARINEDFYTFINDKLYCATQYPELATIDTYPGMVFFGAENTLNAIFRNFNFIKDQTQIIEKVNTLKGLTTFDYFSVYGSSIATNLASFDVENGFTYKEEATLNNDMNASIVSPYVHAYTEQWKMEFDMQTTALGDDGNWGKIIFDLRTLHDFKAVFNWNLRPSADGTINEHNSTSCEVGNIFTAGTMSKLFTDINSKEKTHITIERRPKGSRDDQMTFMFRVKQDGVEEKNSYIVITFSSDKLNYMESPFYLIIHSQKWAGTISNFKFTK